MDAGRTSQAVIIVRVQDGRNSPRCEEKCHRGVRDIPFQDCPSMESLARRFWNYDGKSAGIRRNWLL
jgi:hypothetical protein